MHILHLIKYKYSHLSFHIKNLKATEVLRNLNSTFEKNFILFVFMIVQSNFNNTNPSLIKSEHVLASNQFI